MNKRRTIAAALSAVLLVSALPGLVAAQDGGPFPAEDVQWTLSSISGADVPDGVEVTLLLSEGDANGSAGCNTYFGSYQIDAETLTFPNPFAVTQMICEGPAQETEDAYLPLLQAVAGWSVDEEGMLSLTDNEGTVTLVYREVPVEITATDVAALTAELASLQAQIDEASAEVTALAEEAASIDVNKIDKRIKANEEGIKTLDKRTKGMKDRIGANEKAVAKLKDQLAALTTRVDALEKTDKNLKKRIKTLEETAADHEKRITDLEAAVFAPTPLPQ